MTPRPPHAVWASGSCSDTFGSFRLHVLKILGVVIQLVTAQG
jgi:hypothetical protein